MPPRNNNLATSLRRGNRGAVLSPPPPVMTWGRATPVLVVAGVFDLVRAFFNMFWFFGPALAAVYCTSKASDWVGSLWGLTATVCAGVSAAAGAAVAKVTIPFSVVMADATALLAFLTLGLWILISNARIFKKGGSGALTFTAGFGVSAIPIIGTLPACTFSIWRLYRAQIAIEKVAYATWEKETAAARLQQQKQQVMHMTQIQAIQQAQFMRQEAANDDEYIPQRVDEAA